MWCSNVKKYMNIGTLLRAVAGSMFVTGGVNVLVEPHSTSITTTFTTTVAAYTSISVVTSPAVVIWSPPTPPLTSITIIGRQSRDFTGHWRLCVGGGRSSCSYQIHTNRAIGWWELISWPCNSTYVVRRAVILKSKDVFTTIAGKLT